MWYVSDIAGVHLLRFDGNWCHLSARAEADRLLFAFPTYLQAEQFCQERLSAGCHCRPYRVREESRP